MSVDAVSTFWTSERREEQRSARAYLKTQPSRTCRLFVFSDPESAHQHATILNIHNRHYGVEPYRGRVYLCSADSYLKALHGIGVDEKLGLDFAVLKYGQDERCMVKATLDNERGEFALQEVGADDEPGKGFCTFMQRLDGLDSGQIDQSANIMRWSTDLQLDLVNWAEKLGTLFRARRPDWFHFVFFSAAALNDTNKRARVLSIMTELRQVLDSLRAERKNIQLEEFWFGEFKDGVPRQDKHGTVLNHESQQYPLMVMLRFNDEASLRAWHLHPTHDVLRHQLYCSFSERLARLVAELENLSQTEHDAIQRTSAEIEKLASSYMARRDYIQADTIEHIVQKREFRPKVRFD